MSIFRHLNVHGHICPPNPCRALRRGVCNSLFIRFYLPQLCQLAVTRYDTSSVNRFIIDQAQDSTFFALKAHWIFASVIDDDIPALNGAAIRLYQDTEAAIVQAPQHNGKGDWGRST